MIWAIAGAIYAAVYVVLVSVVADAHARLLAGNLALLLPPLAPLAVVVARRRQWIGRDAVYAWAVLAWALLWLIGQCGWFVDEVLRATPLPWLKWHLLLQVCGSVLPLISLVARPHRREPHETAITSALDIIMLVVLAGFVCWSLIIAPGTEPNQSSAALGALAIVGPIVPFAAMVGLLWASSDARGTEWADVYRRMGLGFVIAFKLI